MTTITRKPGAILSTEKVALDTPTQDVDHGLVKTTGIALPDPVGIENESDTARVKREMLENERFMAEKVSVILADPGNDDDHQFCEVTVNGDYICLRRDGETVYDIKRYHLGVIAQAKVQRLKQTKITNPDGSMGYKEQAVLQPLYPFQVLQDPNRAGVTWLRQLMQRS